MSVSVVTGGSKDLDLPAEDDEKRDRSVADLHQHVSAGDRPSASVRRNPRDLR